MIDFIVAHPIMSKWILIAVSIIMLVLALCLLKPEGGSNGRMQLGDED